MGLVMHPLLLPRPVHKVVALKILTRAEGGPHHPSLPVDNPHLIHLHLHLCAMDTRLSLGLSLVSLHQHIGKVLKQAYIFLFQYLLNLEIDKTVGIMNIYIFTLKHEIKFKLSVP